MAHQLWDWCLVQSFLMCCLQASAHLPGVQRVAKSPPVCPLLPVVLGVCHSQKLWVGENLQIPLGSPLIVFGGSTLKLRLCLSPSEVLPNEDIV